MNALICPLCLTRLMANDQGVTCANGHQFDRAKEGYFNLLPVHHKNSREPGDAKEQLTARRAFLTAGFFSPLLDELKELTDPTTESLLDIGCGEGYFTRGLATHCPEATVYGIDISKAGARLAAKSASPLTVYAVASSQLLPFADASMDMITRIYAPSKDDELRRVIKPEGTLIVVIPGEQHLIGLRHKIYQEIKPHPQPVAPVGFKTVNHFEVDFAIDVPAGDLTSALLRMTPFAWKLKADLHTSLIEAGMKDRAAFKISVYKSAD